MKFQSITTPNIQHDAANAITELILLNSDCTIGPFPWKGSRRIFWGKTVAAIRKLMRDFDLHADQLAFYVYRCRPTEINGAEFAKAATIAKKLFQKYDLNGLMEQYRQQAIATKGSGLDKITVDRPAVKSVAKKSLSEFLKELEYASQTQAKGGYAQA